MRKFTITIPTAEDLKGRIPFEVKVDEEVKDKAVDACEKLSTKLSNFRAKVAEKIDPEG